MVSEFSGNDIALRAEAHETVKAGTAEDLPSVRGMMGGSAMA